MTVTILDDPPPTAVTLNRQVVDAGNAAQANLFDVDPEYTSDSTLVAFVPFGTPCAVPQYDQDGRWVLNVWWGADSVPLRGSSHYVDVRDSLFFF